MRAFLSSALGLLAIVLALCTGNAEAQGFRKAPPCPNGQCNATPAPATYQRVVYTQTTQVTQVQTADPTGFTSWLNAYRASRGLRAVAYDATLSAWCQANNAQQVRRGLGHFVMGPIRCQNSAWSPGGFAGVPGMWANSPPHNANLLNPSITRVGIAGSGAYWTMDGS